MCETSYRTLALTCTPQTPPEFSRIIVVELDRYTQIIRRAGIKAE